MAKITNVAAIAAGLFFALVLIGTLAFYIGALTKSRNWRSRMCGVSDHWRESQMKALLFGATLFALAPTAAMAGGSSTECHGGWYGSGNGGWGPKRYIYECQATSESRYGTAQTTCNSRFGCVTTSEAKRQRAPIVQDPRSTRIMDGHGPR